MTLEADTAATAAPTDEVIDSETGQPFHRDQSLTQPQKLAFSHPRPCSRCNGTGQVLGGICFKCQGARVEVFESKEWAVPVTWDSERIEAWLQRRTAKNESRRRRDQSSKQQLRSHNLEANREAFPGLAVAIDRIERDELVAPHTVKQLLFKAKARPLTAHEAKTFVDLVATLERPPLIGNFIGTVGQSHTFDLEVESITEQERPAKSGGQLTHYSVVLRTLYDDRARAVWTASRKPAFPEGSIVRLTFTVRDHRKTDRGDETVIVDAQPQSVPAGYLLYQLLIDHNFSRTDALMECRDSTPEEIAILRDKLERITRPSIEEPVPADWAEALDQADYSQFVDSFGRGVTTEEAAILAVIPDQESSPGTLFEDDDFVTD
jgi:hypothetical protein